MKKVLTLLLALILGMAAKSVSALGPPNAGGGAVAVMVALVAADDDAAAKKKDAKTLSTVEKEFAALNHSDGHSALLQQSANGEADLKKLLN